MLCSVVFQRVRVSAVTVLGQFRHGGSGHLRPEWHQDLHPVLGSTFVRILQRHQRHRPAEPPHRHDVQLLRYDHGNQFTRSCITSKEIKYCYTLVLM